MFKVRHILHLLALIISACCLLWFRSACNAVPGQVKLARLPHVNDTYDITLL